MMTRQTIASGLMALLLAACAATPPSTTQVAQETPKKPVCEREYRTGSMLAHKDCTEPLSDEERQRLQSDLAYKIRPNPTVKGGGG